MELDILWTILIVSAAIGIGFILVPFLKKKNILTPDNIKISNDLLLFSKIVLNKLGKEKSAEAIRVVRDVLKYIETISAPQTNEEKAKIAKEYIFASLNELNIEIDYETELLIDIVINNALNIIVKREEIK